ncbi:MAG TPA: hypothetical protein VFW96_17615, partial [Thermomicrobiales bacterium]|nr:hypothetical protein [Thermomicrobiales bacterium]
MPKLFEDFDGLYSADDGYRPITGFEGVATPLIEIGNALARHGKLLVIFLDQFENMFFLPDTLQRIRDLLFRLCDAQTNVVLGFSWKTDLVGLT